MRIRLRYFFPLLLILAGCSGSEPEIAQLYWEREWHNRPPREEGAAFEVYETLAVYLQVEDEDGPDDIERLILLHDDKELYWDVSPDEWVAFEEEGIDWISYDRFRMPAGAESANMPLGRYRLEVRDKAGNSRETNFFLEGPYRQPSSVRFPRMEYSSGYFLLNPVHDGEILIWIQNERGQLISRRTQPRGRYTLDDLLMDPGMREQARFITFYEGDPLLEAGLVNGPYDLVLLRSGGQEP